MLRSPGRAREFLDKGAGYTVQDLEDVKQLSSAVLRITWVISAVLVAPGLLAVMVLNTVGCTVDET